MVQDLIRDSTIGQIVNYVSGGRLLPYPEQRPGYVVPKHFLLPSSERKQRESTITTLAADIESQKQIDDATTVPDPYLVDWDGDSDPENPRNWSFRKRAFVAFEISFLTFSIYIGSAIYTSSIPGLMAEFNVSLVTATLGLTLYVLAYGIGPMFLSPLQELPILGRNPVYMATLFLFVIFQIPIVTAKNMSTVLAMRFMTGFFGSPALATGGASMADIFPQSQFAYVLGIWALGAVAGPITGPVIGGFAAQAKGWRWPMMELLWITSFAVVFLSLLLPETYGPTILLRRAERLRKLTGNPELRTAAEREEESKSAGSVVYESLVRPFVLAKEPALAFANIYLGFVYAIFYLWFEAFPLVFNGIYHFNEGVGSLPFLAFIVSGGLTYTVLLHLPEVSHRPALRPRRRRQHRSRARDPSRDRAHGEHLHPYQCSHLWLRVKVERALDRPRHRRGALLLPGIFLNFQSVLMYVTSAYPAYAASVLAGNDFFRSAIASVFPLFGRTFFVNLGLGPGSALLAGISFLLMPVFWLLLKYGHVLRQRSKYAHSP
ncbi:putative caffeine resistance protein [Mycena olivaceomarginata]|nr:putative caffeine resistance protein [Mycena olivaceomarginata]